MPFEHSYVMRRTSPDRIYFSSVPNRPGAHRDGGDNLRKTGRDGAARQGLV